MERLAPEQREEGRRLWEQTKRASGVYYDERRAELLEWLRNYADALLADTDPIDAEAIKREAVRGFAETVKQRLSRQSWRAVGIEVVELFHAWRTIDESAAARSVNLEDEP